MSCLLNWTAVYLIARHEFIRVLTHPLVLVAGVVVLLIALLFGVGGAYNLGKLEAMGTHQEDVLIRGFGSSSGPISTICAIMAVFLGATIIPYERWKNSLSLLLTKPLYRRDYLAGKFIGLSTFMLIFNTFTLLLVGLLMMVFFRGPESEVEFVWRLSAYIVALTLACSLVISLNMLFGFISKSILFVTAASITYIFFDWIWYNDRILGWGLMSLISPMNLYQKIIKPIGGGSSPALFNTTIPFEQWLGAAVPYLVFLLVEVLVLLLLVSVLFSREDTT